MGYFKDILIYLPVALNSDVGLSGNKISNPYPSPENDTQPSGTTSIPYPKP
jgi:hypothetical protein